MVKNILNTLIVLCAFSVVWYILYLRPFTNETFLSYMVDKNEIDALQLPETSSLQNWADVRTQVIYSDLYNIRTTIPRNVKLLAVDPNHNACLLCMMISKSMATGKAPVVIPWEDVLKQIDKYDVFFMTTDNGMSAQSVLRLANVALPGVKEHVGREPMHLIKDSLEFSRIVDNTENGQNSLILFYGDLGLQKSVFAESIQSSFQGQRLKLLKVIDYSRETDKIKHHLPYGTVRPTSLQTSMPSLFVRDVVISLLTVPYAYVSYKEYRAQWDVLIQRVVLDQRAQDTQAYYNMYFPFYDEAAVKYKFTNSKSQLISELFSQNVELTVDYELVVPNELVVDLYIRKVYKRLKISVHAIRKSALRNIHIKPGDVLHLKNQQHPFVEGKYFVRVVNDTHIICETNHMITCGSSEISKYLTLGKTNTAVSINKTCFPDYVQVGESVYVENLDKGGIITKKSESVFEVVLQDDVADSAKKYMCMTSPEILTKTACVSDFDALGRAKKHPDIWDSPCTHDGECPFFMAGRKGSFRGGCVEGACEMPLGVDQLSFRRFKGEPLCHDSAECDMSSEESRKKNLYSFEADAFYRHENMMQ